jgi:hypothetical protein
MLDWKGIKGADNNHYKQYYMKLIKEKRSEHEVTVYQFPVISLDLP